jgi:hypothetical protein
VNPRKGARSRTIQRVVRDPPQIIRTAARRLLPLRWRVRSRTALYRLNTRAADGTPMGDALRAQLRAEFASETRRLAHLIGRDLSAWSPRAVERRA